MDGSHSPFFASIRTKMAQVEKEMNEINNFLSRSNLLDESQVWTVQSALSLGLYNVYNGIEDVMLSIARYIDGFNPSGPSAHQDLLDQLAAPIHGVRSELLDQETYGLLSELKSFRHIIRHRYGHQLEIQRVMTIIEKAKLALTNFKNSIGHMERTLSSPNDESPNLTL